MSPRHNLSIYRVRDHLTDFRDVIVDDVHLHEYALKGKYDFTGRLFLMASPPREPTWADFLSPAFGKLAGIGKTASTGAVLVLRTSYYKDRLFALTFGQGRHLLRSDAFERKYGLRVVLNAVSKGENASNNDYVRIRSVDSTTMQPNAVQVRRQAARSAPMELFEVDTFRDILKAATGLPVETDKWGGRISGSDAVHLLTSAAFHELGQLCRLIEKTHLSDAYRERYGWIDNITAVRDARECEALDQELVSRLAKLKLDGLELGAPELLEWEDVGEITYSVNSTQPFSDFRLADYLDVLKAGGKLSVLTPSHLRHSHRVRVFDGQGEERHSWAVAKCITGELKLKGKNYLLSDGYYFRISDSYLKALNDYVAALPKCKLALPRATSADEGEYNTLAGQQPHLLNLDKHLVLTESRSTPVEICDLLSQDGHFIHVKRKYGSAALSHLFAQGAVSADLLVSDKSFRQKLHEVVRGAEEARCVAEGKPDYRERFAKYDSEAVKTSDIEIVYAVLGDWSTSSLPTWLPFFSKVNLHRHVRELRRMGFQVSLAQIEAQ